MQMNKIFITEPKQQSGAVLIVALVLLLLLTLTGVTSMSTTTSELKVASNQQAYNNSFDSAYSTIETVRRSTDIDWENYDVSAPQSLSTSGPRFKGSALISYDHCQSGVSGNSLTVASQTGDSSGAFGRVVQEIVATGDALNSSNNVIATNVQVNGVSTSVASCP